jgi:cytochrome c-type biogenesis protein CcmH/NrfF
MPESTMATLMVILGPLVLIVAIAWAMMRNRRTRSEEARTEAATRENYARQDAEDKAGTSKLG